MKRLKFVVFLFCLFLACNRVHASSISLTDSKKTSATTYEFALTIQDMKLNTIQGTFNITNGSISRITMQSNWINKTGTNNEFYFYHDGAISGNYTIAIIEVTMHDNSRYSLPKVSYNYNTCMKDIYGNFFGENGTLVLESEFNKTCSKSKDASLKSLKPNVGSLSPSFDSSLELYSMTVENQVRSITWNAIPNGTHAKVISGTTCSLNPGVNLCKIVIAAEAGNQKTYTVTVTRKYENNKIASNDASISNLVVHGGILSPSFQPDKKVYSVKVGKTTQKLYFTFITNSDKKSHTSDACNVGNATTSCTLTIIADDGITKNSYVFLIVHDEEIDTTDFFVPTKQESSISKKKTTVTSSTSTTTNKNTQTTQEETVPMESFVVEEDLPNTNNTIIEEEQVEDNSFMEEQDTEIEEQQEQIDKQDFWIKTLSIFDCILGLVIVLSFIKKKR